MASTLVKKPLALLLTERPRGVVQDVEHEPDRVEEVRLRKNRDGQGCELGAILYFSRDI
jgi:hypothetical protein